MSTSSPRARQLLAAAATISIAWGGMLGLASAADAARPGTDAKPVATASASVTEDTALIQVSVSRAVKQIHTAVCTLDGTDIGCGTPVAGGSKKSATYSISLTQLTPGDHQFTAAFTLTDGGRASASASFTVVPPPATPQSACASVGGTYAPQFTGWECHKHFDTSADMFAASAAFTGALNPVCESGRVRGWYSAPDPAGGREGWNICDYPASHSFVRVCVAAGAYTDYINIWPQQVSCILPTAVEDLTYKFEPSCTQLGGVVSREVWSGEAGYSCAPA